MLVRSLGTTLLVNGMLVREMRELVEVLLLRTPPIS
jgi:hypothetical protein